MNTLIAPTQLKLQFSVPNLSPAPNPKLADKLEKLAAGMQKTIDNKLNPAIGQQNITARRSKIAAGMREEGRQLEIVQRWLEGLAQCHRNGTCPAQFAKVTNRKQLMDFALVYEWHRDDPKYLEKCFLYNYGIVERLTEFEIKSKVEAISAVAVLESLDTSPRIEIDHAVEMAQHLRRQAIYQKVPDFFPTPGEIIARMLQLANVQPHHRCLDPEGGGGDICLALRDFGVENIDCFELNAGLVEALTLLDFPPLGRDFLSATPRPIYERVVMNPPYCKDAYIEHVRNAYQWLFPGGELVAVLPNGYRDSSIKKRREFADWLDAIGGDYYLNPADAFVKSDRSCGVSTHLIHLKR
jgi:hypothetical protein